MGFYLLITIFKMTFTLRGKWQEHEVGHYLHPVQKQKFTDLYFHDSYIPSWYVS